MSNRREFIFIHLCREEYHLKSRASIDFFKNNLIWRKTIMIFLYRNVFFGSNKLFVGDLRIGGAGVRRMRSILR